MRVFILAEVFPASAVTVIKIGATVVIVLIIEQTGFLDSVIECSK